MAVISGAWFEALQGEFKKEYYKKLFETVSDSAIRISEVEDAVIELAELIGG